MKVILSRPAQSDLREIAAWIAQDNPVGARRFVERLRTACRELVPNPERFAVDPQTAFRRRVVGAYLILYRVGGNVEVVRVLNAAQDWPGSPEDDAQ